MQPDIAKVLHWRQEGAVMAAKMASRPEIGNWLAAPVNRATALVACTGMLLYSPQLILVAVRGPQLFWPLNLCLGVVVAGCVGWLGWCAYHARRPAWPARVLVVTMLVGMLLFAFAGSPGASPPWLQYGVPVVAALCVIGWESTVVSASAGLVLTIVFGLACLSPAWGSLSPAAAFGQSAALYPLVIGCCASGIGLNRSLHRQAVVEQGARHSVARAEAVASSIHAHSYWSGVVHDHVLAVLTRAMSMEGDAGVDQLRREAIEARRRLTQSPEELPARLGDVAQWLAEAVGDILPTVQMREELADRSLLLPGEVAAALLAASVEALRNVARHADPAGAAVSMRHDATGIAIVVRDRGPGFDPLTVPPSRLGLRVAVAERLEAVGGRGTWRSRRGQSTVVVLSWPTP